MTPRSLSRVVPSSPMSTSTTDVASLEPAAPPRETAMAAEPEGKLLQLAPSAVARHLRGLDWAFADAPLQEHRHGLYPYPAKFVPQLPRQLMKLLSRPGDLVLDPFSGGGTVGVEALAGGRVFYGIDANPLANAIGRAKTSSPTSVDFHALRALEATLLSLTRAELLAAAPTWLPSIPNRPKWYSDDVFHALGAVRDLVSAARTTRARLLALVAFTQVAARLSFQDSETRYTSKPRAIDILDVPRSVVRGLRQLRRAFAASPAFSACRATFVDGDAQDALAFPPDGECASLVITSPPYPNAYDYHLYHRFRLFWLGENPAALRRVEIGSHLKSQHSKDPASDYLAALRTVLGNCWNAVQPGRYVVLVLGDGLFRGAVFKTAEHTRHLAVDVGFDDVVLLTRPLPVDRRSVTKAGRRLDQEQILVLRRPAGPRDSEVRGPNYRLFPYERQLQVRELAALGGSPSVERDGSIKAVPVGDLDRAAFTHGLRLRNGHVRHTFQSRIEGAVGVPSRRKNSSYLAHGLHRYKGKFYPQLAKSLLNLCGLEQGRSLVADPFGGSGTVALESALSGYDAVSIDCNPLAVAIARAKLTLASRSAGDLASAFSRLRPDLQTAPRDGSISLSQFSPDTLDELARWFPLPVIRKLDWLLGTIRSGRYGDPQLLEILVSDTIREVSQQEPKDLRIRKRKSPLEDAPVYELFRGRLDRLERDLATFVPNLRSGSLSAGRGVIVEGNSAHPEVFGSLQGREIDAVVSSPPYAAALPYIDTDRLSLAAILGYGPRARRQLEMAMIGSREITETCRVACENSLADAGLAPLPRSTLDFLVRYRDAVAGDPTAGFRRRQAPAVLLRYFSAMSDVLGNLVEHMRKGASCWLVVGDSRSTVGGRRWRIPTVDETAAIAEYRGLHVVERLPITVTRENIVHARHAITRNEIIGMHT